MSEPSDWTLLARYLAGECSASEKIQVETWMAADTDNRLLVERMQVIWDTPEPAPVEVNVQQLWLQVADQAGLLEQTRGRRITDRFRASIHTVIDTWRYQPATRLVWRYAVVAVLVISLPLLVANWVGWLPWQSGTQQLITIQMSNAQRSRFVLSDSSSVILDAGSTLRYPEKFARDSRDVFLNGEGFFKVNTDAGRPFTIHASDALIQVLGTKFNVRAWEPDQRVQVAVSEGQVSLRPASSSTVEVVVINEGEGSVMPLDGKPTEPELIAVDEQLGWMHNEAVFRDVPLKEVLYQVERWYDLSFELAVPSVADERVAIYLRNNSVQDILELISSLTDMPFKRIGSVVHLGLPPERTPSGIEED
ncbi:MAG: FecR domain-containing protein [Candidatus Marinimicrobia bacterium]|nr:FecR domain-containing protein [Candidatus Neomarinimicrobiota bacterium]